MENTSVDLIPKETVVAISIARRVAMSVRKASVVLAAGLLVVSSAARADYEDEVLSDEPFAYWRLGEKSGDVARNIGSNIGNTARNGADGTYTGNVVLGVDALIVGDDDSAVAFNGIDSEVRIPSSNLINRVNRFGPFQARRE